MSKSWRSNDDDLKYRSRQSNDDWREELEEWMDDIYQDEGAEQDCE